MIQYYKLLTDIRSASITEATRIFDFNKKRNRPVDQIRPNELELNIMGVMGELAVCEILESENRNYIRNKVDLNIPIKEADILVDGIGIDVKSHLITANEWHLNYKSLIDENKKSDFYWMLKFISDNEILYEIFTRDEVLMWEVKKLKYTDAFCKKIN